ncbi:MAG TPA: MMPL family transporter [Steroidobacteraceae bacterium]|nr:MMPL family transporter [Steroidobacteraceae bacterium]
MTRAGWTGTLVFAVLVAVAAVIVARARYTADLSAFLPRAPTEGQRLLTEELRAGFASRFVMVAIEGADGRTRARVAAGLAQRLRADPAFIEVSDGDAAGFARTAGFLLAHRYQLSDAVTPGRFSAAGLHAAIADNLDRLASPEGLLAKPLFTSDPTGETLHILDGLDAPRIASLDGVWSSRDGRRALLIAQTAAAGSDTDGQEAASAAIRSAFAAATAGLAPPSAPLTLRLSGPGVFAVASRAVIRGQVIRLSTLSAILIAVLLLTAYRSLPALLLTFLPVASGALAGVAAVAVGFGVVHGITLGFGVTLIGEAVDYAIYLFIQSGAGGSTGPDAAPAAEGWRRDFWPTIRLGMLTSVCGFAALVPSGFQGLAQLGLYSIAGLVAAALVTRFVLPEWRPRILRTRDLTALGAALARALTKLRPARAALAVLALLAAFVLLEHRTVLLSRELNDLSPLPAADLELDARLRADLGAPDPRYLVVVSSPDTDAALRAAEAIAVRLEALTAAGVIGAFESPTHYLPSLATQRARQASLPPPAELAAHLEEALAGLPVSAARLAPFVKDVEAARTAPALTPRELARTALGSALEALLAVGGSTTTAFLPISPPSGSDLPEAAIAEVRSAVAAAMGAPPPAAPAGARPQTSSPPVTARLLDLKAEADALYAHYLTQAVSLSLAGLAAILVLLAVTRSPARALRMVAPLALAVLIVAAALAAAGQRLGILHVVGMLLIVAVGSNYALFFDRLAQHERGEVPRTLASLAVANLATVIGFGVLAFSSVPVLAALGRTTAPGALLALVFTALLAPRTALEAAS